MHTKIGRSIQLHLILHSETKVESREMKRGAALESQATSQPTKRGFPKYPYPSPFPELSLLVIAAVNVVLPWSTCPMVPTLTCGLSRTYVFFASTAKLRTKNVCSQEAMQGRDRCKKTIILKACQHLYSLDLWQHHSFVPESPTHPPPK